MPSLVLSFFVLLAMVALSTSFGLHPPASLKPWKTISIGAIPTMLTALKNDASGVMDKLDVDGKRREQFVAFRNDVGTVLKSFVRNSKDITRTPNGKELLWTQLAIYGVFVSGPPAIASFLAKVGSIGAFGGGLLVTAKSMLQLKEQNTLLLTPTRNHHLKTDGMYKYVRHPMYGGIIATCLGHAVLSNSPDKLLLTAALTFVLNKAADVEESLLEATHPLDYPLYAAGKKRFIPYVL